VEFTAVEEAAYIRSLGHDLIVTDHHQKPEILPVALDIVWYDKVVGTTLAWLLSKVLGSKDLQSFSLAALATVTDLQPVLGFNRAIVKKG
jgi:single-stranded-DNA-specific exonuclease